ncbi:hypothetical protein MJL79_28780, partial [Salmonella enterica subsp. enterica serovar Montevideo]|nr:hypothetical protein [Salmonella enterica subsp. enterica serovar Montevideo]
TEEVYLEEMVGRVNANMILPYPPGVPLVMPGEMITEESRPVLAMSYRHFAAYNVIGALLWVLLFTYAGYFFGTIPLIQDNLKLLI